MIYILKQTFWNMVIRIYSLSKTNLKLCIWKLGLKAVWNLCYHMTPKILVECFQCHWFPHPAPARPRSPTPLPPTDLEIISGAEKCWSVWMFIQLLEEVADWLFSPLCVGVKGNIPPRRCVESDGSVGNHEILTGGTVELLLPFWGARWMSSTEPQSQS